MIVTFPLNWVLVPNLQGHPVVSHRQKVHVVHRQMDHPVFKRLHLNAEFCFQVLFKDEEDTLALVFQHINPEDAGLYTCVASTSTGKISCSAELSVDGGMTQLLKVRNDCGIPLNWGKDTKCQVISQFSGISAQLCSGFSTSLVNIIGSLSWRKPPFILHDLVQDCFWLKPAKNCTSIRKNLTSRRGRDCSSRKYKEQQHLIFTDRDKSHRYWNLTTLGFI